MPITNEIPEKGLYEFENGLIITSHQAKSTGAGTIDININGTIYKIRVIEKAD